jgi:hypothetical protein
MAANNPNVSKAISAKIKANKVVTKADALVAAEKTASGKLNSNQIEKSAAVIAGRMAADRQKTASRATRIAGVTNTPTVTMTRTSGVLTKRHPDNQNNAGSRGSRQTGIAKPIR